MKILFFLSYTFGSPILPNDLKVALEDNRLTMIKEKVDPKFIPGKMTQQIYFNPGLTVWESSGDFSQEEFLENIVDLGRVSSNNTFTDWLLNDVLNFSWQNKEEEATTTTSSFTTTDKYTYTTTSGSTTTTTATKIVAETTDKLYTPSSETTTSGSTTEVGSIVDLGIFENDATTTTEILTTTTATTAESSTDKLYTPPSETTTSGSTTLNLEESESTTDILTTTTEGTTDSTPASIDETESIGEKIKKGFQNFVNGMKVWFSSWF